MMTQSQNRTTNRRLSVTPLFASLKASRSWSSLFPGALVLALSLILGATSLHAQLASDPVVIKSLIPSNNIMIVSWEGAIPPYKLQKRASTTNPWIDCTAHIYAMSFALPLETNMIFYRVRTVADRIAPQVPSGLAGLPTSCSLVTLNWTSLACPDQRWCGDNEGGTGLRGYRIYRDGVFLRELNSQVRTTGDSGVTGSRTYSYTIAAIDRAGNESARGPAVVVTTPACPGRPDPVTPANITLAWDANSEADLAGYVLRYGGSSGNYTNSINVGLVTTTTVPALEAGKTYYFGIYAYNRSGLEGPVSNEVFHTP